MEGLVLEVLEPDDRAPTRLKLDSFPVTIGRAVDNTVVLDDPEVSAHHARIERGEDGRLVLRDSQSANGIYDLRSRRRVAELVLAERSKVRLGGSTLRLRAASETLERTVISRLTLLPDDSVFRHRWVFPVLALFTAGAFALDEYVSSYRYPEVARVVFGAVALLLALGVWSGAWALVSKQLRRRFHFLEHGGVASAAVLALALASTAESYLSFSSPWALPGRLLDAGCSALALGWLTYKHLSYCSPWSARRLKAVAGVVALVLVGTVQLYELANAPSFRAQPAFPPSMKAPSFRLARSQSLDEFFDAAKGLEGQADEDARRE
ncbi:MAG: FHA domain-containing protein [Myxococcaceae bacterium]